MTPFEPQHMILRLTADFELDPTVENGRELLVAMLEADDRLGFIKVVHWDSVEYE